MPVRKQHRGYSRSVSGVKYSSKTNEQVGFESTLERDFITLLEFDSNVEYYEEQPVKIHFKNEFRQPRSYTPDFFVKYKNFKEPASWFVPMIFEIKYREDLWKNWKTYKPKFKAAIEYAEKKECRFKILTEKEIRTDYLYNAKFLLEYKNSPCDNSLISCLLDSIHDLRVSTPAEIIASSAIDKKRQAELLHTLWHMLSLEIIGCDLNQKLTMSSEIWSLDTEKPKFILP